MKIALALIASAATASAFAPAVQYSRCTSFIIFQDVVGVWGLPFFGNGDVRSVRMISEQNILECKTWWEIDRTITEASAVYCIVQPICPANAAITCFSHPLLVVFLSQRLL
jgi:hypothetical protein